MGETDDPRAALDAKDVTTRAAAARDLARVGTWDDVEPLVRMAQSERSSAIRLYTAAAAAAIVARHRGAAGQVQLGPDQQQALLGWIGSRDPGTNPGLLMVLSSVADRRALDRLGRMLRDPRNGVRMGAAAAIRRRALSGAAVDDEGLPAAVREWMRHPRIPPDSLLELVYLVGEAGWAELADEVRRAASAGRPHVAGSAETLERLAARSEVQSWEGLWVSDGLDVLEINEEPGPRRWLAIGGGRLGSSDHPSGDLVVSDGRMRLDGEGAAFRQVWAPVLGQAEDRLLAIQCQGTTWWQQSGRELVSCVDALLDELHLAEPVCLAEIARRLEAVDGPLAVRARALIAWKSGDSGAALDLLGTLAQHKRPRADIFWWLGRIHADLDHPDQARTALEAFLDRSGKRSPWRAPATELLAQLAGSARSEPPG